MAFAVGGVLGSMIGGYVYALVGWNAFCISMAVVCSLGAVVIGLFTPCKESSGDNDLDKTLDEEAEPSGDEAEQSLL